MGVAAALQLLPAAGHGRSDGENQLGADFGVDRHDHGPPTAVDAPSAPAATPPPATQHLPPGIPIGSVAGRLVVVSPGGTLECRVEPGRVVVVGSDPGCDLVLPGTTVSPVHAEVERSGPGWLVRGISPTDPTWLLDQTGRAYPITREIGLRSGEVVVGGVHLRLYPIGA